jgi:hypothetical protein
MIKFRNARAGDIFQIMEIEKEYYEGYSCPENIIRDWIKNLSKNFIIAELENMIVGFIFFEYTNEFKAFPFVHNLLHKKGAKYVYVSDIGILNEFKNSDVLQKLFSELIKRSKKDKCKSIIWITGTKLSHDKIESKLLFNNNFVKEDKIMNWEAYPNHFVNDHYIWTREL